MSGKSSRNLESTLTLTKIFSVSYFPASEHNNPNGQDDFYSSRVFFVFKVETIDLKLYTEFYAIIISRSRKSIPIIKNKIYLSGLIHSMLTPQKAITNKDEF